MLAGVWSDSHGGGKRRGWKRDGVGAKYEMKTHATTDVKNRSPKISVGSKYQRSSFGGGRIQKLEKKPLDENSQITRAWGVNLKHTHGGVRKSFPHGTRKNSCGGHRVGEGGKDQSLGP